MSFIGDFLGFNNPSTPDPYSTSAAQTASNEATARTNAALNRYNQFTPYGNMIWTNKGNDAWDLNVNLDPQELEILNNSRGISRDLNSVTQKAMGNVNSVIGQPAPNYDNAYRQKLEDALYQRSASRLDPQFGERQRALESQLTNQGILRGSQAWKTGMDELSRDRNDAYALARENAIAGGRTEAATDFATKWQSRNNLLNELNALRSGQQVTQPQFQAQNTSATVAPTDVSGNIWNAYQANQAKTNAGVNTGNSILGGLAGLGGASILSTGTLTGAFSDPQLKTQIIPIGIDKDGIVWYQFGYLWAPDIPMFGVMADEVQQRYPEVVQEIAGFLHVDYRKLEDLQNGN